jgi:hypothetical protein
MTNPDAGLPCKNSALNQKSLKVATIENAD